MELLCPPSCPQPSNLKFCLAEGPLEGKSCGVQLTRNCTPGPLLPLTTVSHRGHDSEDICLPLRVVGRVLSAHRLKGS